MDSSFIRLPTTFGVSEMLLYI
jgi:hypothetical protein